MGRFLRTLPTSWLSNSFRPLTNLAVAVREKPKPTGQVKCRDFQRAKVYRWERANVHNDNAPLLSLDECRDLVTTAYIWWEQPTPDCNWAPPLVTDGRGRRHACGSRQVIKLPRWARRATIVLHECAHGMSRDAHGPDFVRAYICLLAEFADMPRDVLQSSALAARLKVAPLDN